jgi:hypothetical protein
MDIFLPVSARIIYSAQTMPFGADADEGCRGFAQDFAFARLLYILYESLDLALGWKNDFERPHCDGLVL